MSLRIRADSANEDSFAITKEKAGKSTSNSR